MEHSTLLHFYVTEPDRRGDGEPADSDAVRASHNYEAKGAGVAGWSKGFREPDFGFLNQEGGPR